MFMHITSDSSTRVVTLPRYLHGEWYVAVREIWIRNGMFNIKKKVVMEARADPDKIAAQSTLKAGNYTFKEIKNFLLNYFKRVLLNKNSGKLTLILDTNAWAKVVIPVEFSHLLGFREQVEMTQEFNKSKDAINLLPCTTLNFALPNAVEGISVNGQPSFVIKSIPYPDTSFGGLYTKTFNNPEFYRLTNNVMTDITLNVFDERGETIDNHGLPIEVIIHFKKNVKPI